MASSNGQRQTSPKPLSAKLERRILNLYAQGFTRIEVADKCGVSHATVSRVHKKYGIPMRTRGGSNNLRLDDNTVKATKALYRAGYSEIEIGEILGVTRGGVAWRLDRPPEPVERRTISQAMKVRGADKSPVVVILAPFERKRRGKPKLNKSRA